MSSSSLTPKQESFALAYLETGNASEAYRRSYDADGMNPASVNREAHELLVNPKIAARLEELKAAQVKRHEVTVDRLVSELSAIAFADPGDFFDWGPKGVTVKEKDGLTPAQRRLVSEVSQTVTEAGGTIKVKLHPKLEAMEKLAKHLGMYKADNEQGAKAAAEAAATAAETSNRDLARAILAVLSQAKVEPAAPTPHKEGEDED